MVTGEAADTAGETASPGVRTRKEPSEVHCALGIHLLISKTKQSGVSGWARPKGSDRTMLQGVLTVVLGGGRGGGKKRRKRGRRKGKEKCNLENREKQAFFHDTEKF